MLSFCVFITRVIPDKWLVLHLINMYLYTHV